MELNASLAPMSTSAPLTMNPNRYIAGGVPVGGCAYTGSDAVEWSNPAKDNAPKAKAKAGGKAGAQKEKKKKAKKEGGGKKKKKEKAPAGPEKQRLTAAARALGAMKKAGTTSGADFDAATAELAEAKAAFAALPKAAKK